MSKAVTTLDKATKEALAKEHKAEDLRLVDIPLNEDELEFQEVVIRVPTRNVLGQYQKWADANPKKASEILLKGCLLTNKEQVIANDYMFNTTVSAIAELIPIGSFKIKKFS